MPLTLATVNLSVSVHDVIDEVKPTHPGVEIVFDADGDLRATTIPCFWKCITWGHRYPRKCCE
jgi:hypothetical protein